MKSTFEVFGLFSVVIWAFGLRPLPRGERRSPKRLRGAFCGLRFEVWWKDVGHESKLCGCGTKIGAFFAYSFVPDV